MKVSLEFLKINILYAILIIIQFRTLLGQLAYSSASLRNEQLQILEINNHYKFNEKQLNKIFWLDIFASQPSKFEYYIVQIDFYYQDLSFQIKACLNFQLENIQQKDKESCFITDFDATNEKLSQHLLVIKRQDINFQSNKNPFLAIYKQNLKNSDGQEVAQGSLEYEISIYFSDSYPCHNNCHGHQGRCNSQLGTCVCNQNYIGADCGVQLNPLTLIENKNITNIAILDQDEYFKIDINLSTLNENNIFASLNLQVLQNPQNLKLLMLFNDYELPNETNYHLIYEMTTEHMIIQNLEELCKQKAFKDNQYLKKQDNQNEIQSAAFTCTLIVKVIQLMEKQEDQQSQNIGFKIVSQGIQI
ncbi:hypothetical protein ABPG74_008143 [Tetrahymena malaccensis]